MLFQVKYHGLVAFAILNSQAMAQLGHVTLVQSQTLQVVHSQSCY